MFRNLLFDSKTAQFYAHFPLPCMACKRFHRHDTAPLRTLIREMAEYEKLACLITEEALARDGFGTQPALTSLIAEWGGQPAG